MSFWTHLLRCSDDRYYTGHTDDLERRVSEHRIGRGCGFTRRRLPVTLVWAQEFGTCIKALEAEQRIKPWSRAKKEALIAGGDWSALSCYARAPRERPSTSLGTNEGMPVRPKDAAR